jgi:hypothetical protein
MLFLGGSIYLLKNYLLPKPVRRLGGIAPLRIALAEVSELNRTKRHKVCSSFRIYGALRLFERFMTWKTARSTPWLLVVWRTDGTAAAHRR